MRSIISKIVLILLLVSGLSSCIKNDIPLPVVPLSITNVEGEGFKMDYIDTKTKTVYVTLEEKTDIKNVYISNVDYSEDAELSKELIGRFDLREPLIVTLSFYQDYEWKIVATQNFERYFKVKGQVGEETINVDELEVTIPLPIGTDLTEIEIVDFKLGPEEVSHYSAAVGDKLDLSLSHRTIDVDYHDIVEVWRINTQLVEVQVELSKCEVWAKVAYLEAYGDTDNDYGFRYRKAGVSEWTEVSKDDISTQSGSFKTTVYDLEPETDYEFIAYSGEETTASVALTTEKADLLPNGGLEDWDFKSGIWSPNASDAFPVWGTGNPGSAIGGVNITTPDETELRPGTVGVKSAELKSQKVLGLKLAAGNLFIGKYVATKGTNGIVGFGTPFTSRPRFLRGWVKYTCGTIDNVGPVLPPGKNIEKGVSPDEGMIYIALGTWTPEEYGVSAAEPEKVYGTADQPIIVDTRDKGTFFNPESDAVVAYGEAVYDKSFGWTQFEIPLDYNLTSVLPTHLVIVCTGSRFGDYFTGSSNSCMWLDDLELVY